MNDNLDNVFVEDVKLIVDDLSSFFDELEGKTILVAGGKGFLGTYFTNVLTKINEELSKPMKIIVLDSLITSKDKKNYEDDNIEFLEQDISQKFDIKGNVDYIIHAASLSLIHI